MSRTLTVPLRHIAIGHTAISIAAFATALFLGWAGGLWQDLCVNSVARWPDEWLPSVSATIGDHALGRDAFQIMIALCATPRFLVLGAQWLLHSRGSSGLSKAELVVGVLRTIACGGWMYITSRDSHNLHDCCMILYLLLNLPWMALSSHHSAFRLHRTICFGGFLATIPPLIWQFYRHSVLRIPGAYSTYAIFEWSLVFWDIAFDSASIWELRDVNFTLSDQLVTAPLAPRTNKPTMVADWTVTNVQSSPARGVLAYLSDVTFAAVFWTLFTALPMQLFYWSVWQLALAGTELALLFNLAPLLLGCSHSVLSGRSGMTACRGIAVVFGLTAFALPTPALRLLAVGVAVSAAWLAVVGDLARIGGSTEAYSQAKILSTGLSITVVLKYVNRSSNPFWCTVDSASGGWNWTGLAFATLGLIEFATRPVDLFAAPPTTPAPHITASRRYGIAVGFGCLLHLIHTFCTDAGTVIAWTWTGFPIKGPVLYPHGAWLIAAFALGIQLQEGWSLTGLLSATVLYRFDNWAGFLGGAGLVFYLASSLPAYLLAGSRDPVTVFGFGALVYCLLDVASVVTTAYAFVPYGYLLRERTDLVLGFCLIAIAAVGQFVGPASTPRKSSLNRISSVSNATLVASTVLVLVSALYRPTSINPAPRLPDHQIFSAGIWTVHFGVDLEGRDSQYRMRDLLRDMEVDVVGLLETDLHRFVYGNRDLTRAAAEELGYYVDLGPGPNKHTWGAALLSKFPILNSTHHLLPSPHGELAPAIHATLDVHGQRVDVFVSHNGQEEDALDRELQTTEIARILRETEDVPTVFLGYLVTHPGDRRPWPYQILQEDGRMWDIEKEDKWRWCEYIFFRGLWRIAFARIHEGTISDTELQVGKFMLPTPGKPVLYENDKEMYWHIGESDVPEPWHMPAMFRDEGVRGHHYRVWIGPVYYLPPVRSGLQRFGQGWSTALPYEGIA